VRAPGGVPGAEFVRRVAALAGARVEAPGT
jgi:hypothetical protein